MLHTAELHRLAQQGATLLAPNLRSARQLRAQFTSLSAETDPASPAVLNDRVLHWRGWTANLWQQALLQGLDDRVLLQPLQERLLWEQLLDEAPDVERTDALTDLCLSASTLVHRYAARSALLNQASSAATGDASRFAKWFRQFDRHCKRERLLPAAGLEEALATHLGAGNLPGTPTTLVLCDPHNLTPVQAQLLSACSEGGTRVLEAPQRAGDPPSSLTLLRCADDADELHVLVEAIADRLQGKERPNVAVIVPDLSVSRDRIDRVLREQLGSAYASPFQEERQPLWEFSTGRPLAAVTSISDVLRLLTWTVRELEAAELSSLLRSPYLEWPVSAEQAASLDASLLRRKAHLRATWSPRTAANVLRESSPALADAIHERTSAWHSLRPAKTTFSNFADRTRRILREFGWPGTRTRTSQEFQAVQRWDSTLDALAALDIVAPSPTWPDFLDRLTAATRDTTFARENTGAPIQFLTPEESAGTEAGDLWVVHADEDRWNSRKQAHPLLPWPLQQKYGMPGVDPTRDQARFQDEISRIAGMGANVTFSYAHIGNSGEQRPSPLLMELPGIQFREHDASGVVTSLAASSLLQTFTDDALVPLKPTEISGPIQGGVSILQSQAACAFRAFAERRLASSALESQDLGLDARDRGSLLHRALQIFWETVKDQGSLRNLIAEDRLRQAIHRAVEQALRPEQDTSDSWAQHYLAIQQVRLESLLDQWLRTESERPPFRVVALEQKVNVTIGPLPLSVRVDRIDEVTTADGSTRAVILDYKTSDHTPRKWVGDRPEEPQLPLYATTATLQGADGSPLPVGAIAFGVVRPGKDLGFRDMPPKSALLRVGPKVSTATLDADLESWRLTLETLAHDFAAGIATVGPKEYPSTCKFCDQRLLCRLNPELLDSEVEEAGDEP